MAHPTLADLEAALDSIRAAPRNTGTVTLVVRRPGEDQREVLEEGQLDPDSGLVGDAWMRGDHGVDDQLTLMNSPAIDLLAGDRERWPLAGDQLYVDFDLSEEALPAGTRLTVGEAGLSPCLAPLSGSSPSHYWSSVSIASSFASNSSSRLFSCSM